MKSRVIHTSGWAVTRYSNGRIQKIFAHDAFSKIQKEVNLLRLSSRSNVQLYFDRRAMKWVSETEYIELRSPFEDKDVGQTISQLQDIFTAWNKDPRYTTMVDDDWDTAVKPGLIKLLEAYLPNAEAFVSILSGEKSQHFIHGDFTLSNVYKATDGRLIVLDYENAGTGPQLWDETTFVYSLIEDRQYDIAEWLFDAFHCSPSLLLCIAGIRLARSRRKSQNEDSRNMAYQYILAHYSH